MLDIRPSDTLESAQDKLLAGLRGLGAEDEESAAVVSVLAYVLGLGSIHPLRQIDPEQLKRQILLGVRILLERRLQQRPVVLVVEDLHWADAAAVEVLCQLVDRLADRSLRWLVTHRPTLDARALATTRAASTAIRLTPLSQAESEQILAAFFDDRERRAPAGRRRLDLHAPPPRPAVWDGAPRASRPGALPTR